MSHKRYRMTSKIWLCTFRYYQLKISKCATLYVIKETHFPRIRIICSPLYSHATAKANPAFMHIIETYFCVSKDSFKCHILRPLRPPLAS